MNPAGTPVFSLWLCCSISSLSVWAMPEFSKKKLPLQLGIKPSLCHARDLLFRGKVSTFSSSSTLELMIITPQMRNWGNEDGVGKGEDAGGMCFLWHDSIYQMWAEGLCSLLLSKVTEELTQELQDKVEAVFPDVFYLFSVYQTQPVNSLIFLYLKKKEERERKNCVCCSGEYFNIWNSHPL